VVENNGYGGGARGMAMELSALRKSAFTAMGVHYWPAIVR